MDVRIHSSEQLFQRLRKRDEAAVGPGNRWSGCNRQLTLDHLRVLAFVLRLLPGHVRLVAWWDERSETVPRVKSRVFVVEFQCQFQCNSSQDDVMQTKKNSWLA